MREDSKTLDSVVDSYPLSPLQEGMLFHSLFAHRSGVDIEQMVCDLPESIDASALERAWQAVSDRHAVLRTSFHWEGLTAPIQRVHSRADVPFESADWRAFEPAGQARRLESYLSTDRRRGFDLSKAPLLRLALFRRSDASYWLVWTFHHAVLDGRSFPTVIKEVFANYDAFSEGRSLLLDRPRPYREHIDWLRTRDISPDEGFWRKALSGFRAPTRVGIEKGGDYELEASARTGRHELRLSRGVTSALRSLGEEHGLTLNTFVEGAWAIVLSRYSGEDDVVFGVTRAGRPREVPNADSMIGLFINTLPLRISVRSREPLISWLQQVRAAHRAVAPYEHTPLVKIQEWSEVPRGTSLFHSILVFDNYQLDELLRVRGGAWMNRSFRLHDETNYPLTLRAYGGEELVLNLAWRSSEIIGDGAAQLIRGLHTALEGMAADPSKSVGDVPLLSREERHRLLVTFNETRKEYPGGTVHQLFEATVARNPERIAVQMGQEQLSYAELDRSGNSVARRLQALGVKPETRVAICAERSPRMLAGLLGILKAGGAYLPLDPRYPRERVAFMLSDAGADIILTQRSLLERIPVTESSRVLLLDDSDVLVGEDRPRHDVSAGNLAYVIYTSGSTGMPKGVAIEHRSAVAFLHWARDVFPNDLGDAVLASTSINFDLSVFELFGPLCAGGRVVLETDVLALAAAPTPPQVRLINTVPSVMGELLRLRELPPSVRTVSLAGEALPRSLVDRIFTTGSVEKVFNLYGPTEDTTYSTWAEVYAGSDRTPPIGRPIANTRAYILNAECHPVPVGVAGELYLGGSGLARGYLNRPELTAEKFIPDAFDAHPGGRLYRTGDWARYLSDGQIEYLGRQDEQVKLRGFRIELGEIEEAISHHPQVHEAVVALREDAPGDKRLVAYLVLRDESWQPAGDLRDLLKLRLPEHMIPSAFVVLDAMPRTVNGKTDRGRLPAPDPARQGSGAGYTPPATDLEDLIADVWKRTLGVRRVGRTDEFFELGGHSLLAIRVVSALREALQVELSLRTIFDAPTVGALADVLTELETRPGELNTLARVWKKIEGMSGDEVQIALETRRMTERESGAWTNR